MRRFLISTWIVVLGQIGLVTESQASLIKLSIVGTIDQVIAGGRSAGEQVTGTLVYDTATPLTHSTCCNPYQTNFNGAIKSFELADRMVDDVNFNILSPSMYFSDGTQRMGFAFSGFDQATGLTEDLDLDIEGTNLFSDVAFLPDTLDFSNVSQATFEYSLQQVGDPGAFLQERFYGTVTGISVSAVPVPGTHLLMGLSSILLLGRRSRRKYKYLIPQVAPI